MGAINFMAPTAKGVDGMTQPGTDDPSVNNPKVLCLITSAVSYLCSLLSSLTGLQPTIFGDFSETSRIRQPPFSNKLPFQVQSSSFYLIFSYFLVFNLHPVLFALLFSIIF